MKNYKTPNRSNQILPQAAEFEISVLGQMLTEAQVVDTGLSMLAPEMFTDLNRKRVYEAIKKLADQSQPVDTITVVEKLRSLRILDSVGGPAFITSLTRKILSATNFEYYCFVLVQKYISRQTIEICSKTIDDAYNEEETAVKNIEQRFDDLYSSITRTSELPCAQKIMTNALLHFREKSNKSTITGVPSGLSDLDKVTLGWQSGEMSVIGARPSVGKTALALQFAINAAVANYKVMFFSLEMNMMEIGVRLLTNQTGVNYIDIKTGSLQHAQTLDRSCDHLFSVNLFIDDNSLQDVYSLRNKIRLQQRKTGVDLVIIDYLQLINGDPGLLTNSNRYFGEICRQLKLTAKKLNVPILLLSQLSREVEKRLIKPFPVLADLRDSGEIEQHADVVLFPTRFIKLPQNFHYDENGNDRRKKAHIEIAKNRNGDLKKFLVNVSDDKSRWTDDSSEIHNNSF